MEANGIQSQLSEAVMKSNLLVHESASWPWYCNWKYLIQMETLTELEINEECEYSKRNAEKTMQPDEFRF